jgi:arylsulfatase A-like enzyme/Tfp pilus assembly protein PilF
MASRKKRRKRKSKNPELSSHAASASKPGAGPIPKPRNHFRLLVFAALFAVIAGFIVVFRIIRPTAGVKKDPGLNVLIITLDTTRADRLGCYGYPEAGTPSLDALAAGGVRFENAICQVPLTGPSHCSLFTGAYPFVHQVHNNGSYILPPEIQTLAETLKASGRATAAFVSSFSVDSRFGLGRGFDVYDDNFAAGQPFKSLNAERRADEVYAPFARWLDAHKADRFFAWVHFFDPHIPYDPPSPYKERFASDPYDGEIAFMDEHVGKIVGKLRDNGILQRTLIIIAGDHGEAFGEKEEKGHGVFLYEPTMRVPLIFYAENRLPRGRVVGSRVRLIDIPSSVQDMLGLPGLKDSQGTSLLPYIQGKRKDDLGSYIETYYPRENYGWSELVGLLRGEWKYIRAPREELYDLKRDPGEEKNLAGAKPDIVRDMGAGLDKLVRESPSPSRAEKKTLTGEEAERLRALGYVAMADGPSGKTLPDPKDQTAELRLIRQAEETEAAGNLPEAAAARQRILAMRPEVASSYVNLAYIQARMMKFDDVIRTLEQGLARVPDSEVLLLRLGNTFMVTGRVKKALEAFDRVLKTNPRSFDALLASALMLDAIGQKTDALAYYRNALQIEPENRYGRTGYAQSLSATGRFGDAIQIYEDLTRNHPDDPAVLQDLGITYSYAGNLSRSIECLEKAISLRPTPVAYFNLARAMVKQGKIGDAVRYLKLYLENPEGESEQTVAQARAELQKLERYADR